MSIESRIAKLEKKLIPKHGSNIEVVVCEIGETSEQARKRLGINGGCDNESKTIIFVVFD